MADPETLEFLRADTPGIAGRLVRSTIIATIGAMVLLVGGLSIFLHVPKGLQPFLAAAGTVTLLYGLTIAFVTIPRALFDDSALSVRRDGLFFEGGKGKSELFAWDAVVAVAADAGELVLTLDSGETRRFPRTYGGKTAAELATLIEHTRKKAALNLRA
jgi:hypothetical protein